MVVGRFEHEWQVQTLHGAIFFLEILGFDSHANYSFFLFLFFYMFHFQSQA